MSLDVVKMVADEATNVLPSLEYGVPGYDVLADILREQEAKLLMALRHVKVSTESLADENSRRRLLIDIQNLATTLVLPSLPTTATRQGSSWRSLRK